MTDKIEVEFSETNYEGSRVFSSLANVLGLSVDLVSLVLWLTSVSQSLLATPIRKAILLWTGEKKKNCGADKFRKTWIADMEKINKKKIENAVDELKVFVTRSRFHCQVHRIRRKNWSLEKFSRIWKFLLSWNKFIDDFIQFLKGGRF